VQPFPQHELDAEVEELRAQLGAEIGAESITE
jgi:hypothetical protein